MPSHSSAPRRLSTACLAALALAACGTAPEDVALSESGQALTQGGTSPTPLALSRSWAERTNFPHGIAGDARYVFLTEPLNGRVVVLDRTSRQEIAELPAPAGGFILPFQMRIPQDGTLVVLDAGGFPSPTQPAIPRVYTYAYATDAQGALQLRLVRAVSFDGIPFGFAEDLEALPGGEVVVSDSVLGSLWLVQADGSIVPGITPKSLDPADTLPQLGGCLMAPNLSVGGIPFAAPGDFAPGSGSMGYFEGDIYLGSSCLGGLRRVPASVLHDGRQPWERAADIETVSARAANVPLESIKGINFNRFDPTDRRAYVTDCFNLKVLRIDVDTGEREVLSDDGVLFDFPVTATILPPLHGHSHTPMLVVSDQEERMFGLNVAIDRPLFRPTFTIATVEFRR